MFCSKCGAQNAEGARFCEKCGAALGVAQAGFSGAAPTDERMRGGFGMSPGGGAGVSLGPGYVTGKNPVVALLLSLIIPGVGQFYNGDTKKGAIMLGIHLLSFFFWAVGIGFVTMFGVWVWGMYDAYQVASGKAPIMK